MTVSVFTPSVLLPSVTLIPRPPASSPSPRSSHSAAACLHPRPQQPPRQPCDFPPHPRPAPGVPELQKPCGSALLIGRC